MTLPDIADLSTYGGAFNDYSPPVDSSTDKPAAAGNPEAADVAFMSHLTIRCGGRVTLSSTGAVFVAHDEGWNNTFNPTAPTPARSTTGTFTITYPTTIIDEIPAGSPGYNASGHVLNLRFAIAQAIAPATWSDCKAVVTSANVVTLYFYGLSGGVPTLMDPASATDVYFLAT
jgi:hypothetical protein